MIEYRASPADGHHHAFGAGALHAVVRLVDAAIASLQRVRNRIETPAVEDADAPAPRTRKAAAVQAEVVPAAAPPKPRRLRRFALAATILSAAAMLGTAVSYRQFSQSLNADEAVIEGLRDEIAQMDKDGARILRDKLKYQKQTYEDEKAIRALQQEVADYRMEVDELRGQLAATKARGRGTPAASNPPVPAAGRAPVPQKTGNCTTGTANTAADIARCVAEFNRR